MFTLVIAVINIKMAISKVHPMIISLFHKYIFVPLWVLDNAEDTAVMKTVLGLVLTEPTVWRKAETDSSE